jgi:hypothetical protein
VEDAAEALGHGLKRNGSGVIRNRQARVSIAILQKRSENLERFGKVMHYAGKAMAAYDSVKNFKECEEGK